tara:strand:- start:491 stop:1123 length:633 start_codon:yes stop_codon:yes gene_type:complete
MRDPRKSLTDFYSFEEYGRYKEEMLRDKRLFAEEFLTDHEYETIADLCDLILPATDSAGSAGDAHVPEFIDFIVKDMPNLQKPIRNGIKWLDDYAKANYNSHFIDLDTTQKTEIMDAIAYPDKSTPETKAGIEFFTRMRNLTLTGYYTSEIGFKDIGYEGNRPNVWDGVPQDVLDEHDLSYDEEWLAKCINHQTSSAAAEWDKDGNLLNN